ncbi:hypothetical protein [Streptomyces flaveolus]|uniref:hypothetical protein n=1 Tax=Streptomyces flaveolus TaxID=67297 RepID=UPI0036FD9FC2
MVREVLLGDVVGVDGAVAVVVARETVALNDLDGDHQSFHAPSLWTAGTVVQKFADRVWPLTPHLGPAAAPLDQPVADA